MNTITKIVVLASLCLFLNKVHAQDTIQNPNQIDRIKEFNDAKERVKEEEKQLLKDEVETINQRLEKGEISKEDAEKLKLEAAKKHALNIENRLAIIDNQMAFYLRNPNTDTSKLNNNRVALTIGGDRFLYIDSPGNRKPAKYDIRTTNDLLFAIGFNNTIMDGKSIDDSPYQIGGSGFVELGWIWKTRLLKNSNTARVTYGFSFQWNKLSMKDNMYFVKNGDEISLEEFPLDLKKSKFRTTSLVIPVHFEFGPSKKVDYDDRVRYSTHNQFKIGIGGFAGLNLNTLQKLKYRENGDDQKQKDKSDFNTTNFVYGLSSYIGIGDFSVYAKYNLNELFKDQAINQHNVSLGLRWDLD